MFDRPLKSSVGDHERDEGLYSGEIKRYYKTKGVGYPEEHPWYDGANSLQIHHVIDIKAVENMGSVFKQFDYNINHAHNLVVLPSKMELACRLAVPLHAGKHSLGRAFGDKEQDKGVADILALETAEESANNTKEYKKTVVKAEEDKKKYKAYPDATKKELKDINKLKESGMFCYDKKGKVLPAESRKNYLKLKCQL